MAKETVNNSIKLIIIGGSSGSLKVILELLTKLRPDFKIPILLVLHRNSQHESVLTELLAAKSRLQVKEVEEKEAALPASIYIAPQDYHVLLESNGCFSLDYSEKIHYSRPSIDVSFKSAAAVYAKQLVAVLLSGANADGAEGLQDVKKAGGTTIVQDPEEAEVNYMPQQALLKSAPNFILRTPALIELLNNL